jgi:hypothetical protein
VCCNRSEGAVLIMYRCGYSKMLVRLGTCGDPFGRVCYMPAKLFTPIEEDCVEVAHAVHKSKESCPHRQLLQH